MKSRKGIVSLLLIQVIVIFFIVQYYNASKNIIFFVGSLLIAMLCAAFFRGFYILQLKKSIIGLCNLKKRGWFEKNYILCFFEYLPTLAFLIWIGVSFQCTPVVLCIVSYQIINFFLILLNVKKTHFIAFFIVMMFLEMFVFLLYQNVFF